MKKLMFAMLFVLSFGGAAYAQESGLALGAQTTDVETDSTGTTLDGGTGFYVGWMGYQDLGRSGAMRAGILFSQRKFDIESGGNTAEVELQAIDVPVTYMFKVSEAVGLFGGVKLGLNLSDDCTEESGTQICTGVNAESLYYGLDLGGHFRFAPNFAFELDYTVGLSDMAKDIEWDNSLAINVVYLF